MSVHDSAAKDAGGTVNAEPQESEAEKQLNETGNSSTGAGQPSCGAQADRCNERYIPSGHKTTDRKTGVAQSDEHYSWRQVYRLCETEGYGHE